MTLTQRVPTTASREPSDEGRAAGRRGSASVDRGLLRLAIVVSGVALASMPVYAVLNQMLVRHAPRYADSVSDQVFSDAFGVLLIGVALVVIVRARRNPIGWLLLGLIVLGGVAEAIAQQAALVGLHVPGRHVPGAGGWAAFAESLERPEFGLVCAVLLLFPTGRVPSPRWRPVGYALCVVFPLWFVAHLLGPGNPQEPPFRGVHNPLAVAWLGNPIAHYAFLPSAGLLGIAVVASVIVRYRASEGDERQQLKWLALLAAGLPIGLAALGVASLIGDGALNAVGDVIWVFPQIGLPLAVAIAITRYRLYDLDLLVNRTIVYGSLSVVLAATYGLVVLLATKIVVSAGWTSPGVVASATLVAAATAAPARRAIQGWVDRVFGRRAWDAEQLLAAFTARWRDSPQPSTAVRDVMAEALRDPDAELGYWLRARQAYVDADNHELRCPQPGSGRSMLRIDAGGEPVALVVHDAALDRDPRLLAGVARSAALVLENARLQVEVFSQLAEVAASRARIVEAADAERRRVERDLHDGAQQRLVGLAMRVKLAARGADNAAVLEEIVRELQLATRELRELARGIHPAALAEGLAAAVESLVARSPLRVEVELPAVRLPDQVELTAYYVVAEAITNASRHAGADRIAVHGAVVGSRLELSVHDDGCGGADARRGTGLAGLADRAAATGGHLELHSVPQHGTTVRVSLPCGC